MSLYIILVYIAPCFDVLYSGIWGIHWSYLIFYFLRFIYRHHFCLNLAFFYFLYSLTCMFSLKHVVSSIWLRLHATQAQHTTILRQIQHHLGNTSTPEHAIPTSSGASYRRDSWAIISTASLHVSKKVPLPPYFSIAFVTLRTMFSLVGGRVEEGSIVINAKLFW